MAVSIARLRARQRLLADFDHWCLDRLEQIDRQLDQRTTRYAQRRRLRTPVPPPDCPVRYESRGNTCHASGGLTPYGNDHADDDT